jgi:hypothetical protein
LPFVLCFLPSNTFQCTSCFGGGEHGKKQKANGKKQISDFSIQAAPLVITAKSKRQRANGKFSISQSVQRRYGIQPAFLAFCSLLFALCLPASFNAHRALGVGEHGKKQKANGKKQIFDLSIHAASL